MFRRVLTAAAAALLLAPAAAHAGGRVVTFGANLNRPANLRADCTVMLLPDFLGRPVIPFGTGTRSCTWFTVGRRYNDPREGTLVPVGRGRIVRVRIRTGPVTGPMRVVVLESLRGTPGEPTVPDPRGGTRPGATDAVCCKQISQSRVFVPRRNAVSTFVTNIPVRNSGVRDPRTGLAYFDILALSVLAPGVPVPANVPGDFQPLTAPISMAMYPALRNGEERAGGSGQVGFVTLLQATWVRTGGDPLRGRG